MGANRTNGLLINSVFSHILLYINSCCSYFGGSTMLRSFFAKEEGQGLVEYALILALIAIVVIGVLTLLGRNVNNKISQIGSALN